MFKKKKGLRYYLKLLRVFNNNYFKSMCGP